MHIKLGWKVKDKVSGITGIAVARIVYLNGCVQYCVVPAYTPGALEVSSFYIDLVQLVKVDDGVLSKPEPKSKERPKNMVTRGGTNLRPQAYGKSRV